jgi:glycerol-3-phosphate dehydrogenase
MKRLTLAELSGQEFDVVVIGAGVNGASGGHHLAAAGYRVLIVDKNDYGSGSSSRSSRLLHCGLRFIEPGEGLGYRNPSVWEPLLHPLKFLHNLSRVRDAMTVRDQVSTTMPSRVSGFRFHFPVWRGDVYKPWHVSAGMRLVDSVRPSGTAALEAEKIEPQRASQCPLLRWLRNSNDLLSVHSWKEFRYEWPERIVMDTVVDAVRLGAIARNHTAVTALTHADDMWRIDLTDAHDEAVARVSAKSVLNTTGIWTDHVNRYASTTVGRRIMGTKGSHIMFRLPPDCALTGICTHTTKREPFYIVPWRGMHYAGPTDTEFEGDIDDVRATEDEIQHLVDEVNALLPGGKLNRSDVLFSWAGVRPLTYSPDEAMGLRGHRLHDLSDEGMPNVFNMTSSPIMSHRLAGVALCEAVRRKVKPSGSVQQISYAAAPSAPDCDSSPSLLNHWSGATIAHLRHSAEHEQPVSLEDLLFRRVGAGWTETMAREGARVAAEAVADILDWDQTRIASEVDGYLKLLAHRHGVDENR